MGKVAVCLWFGRDAEAAVRFYVSLLPDSGIDRIARAPAAYPGGEAGDVVVMDFRLGGQRFQALNGGEPAAYGTAASIAVSFADAAELDRVWDALLAGGGAPMACGWLRDRWGVPWQIVPDCLPRLMGHADAGVRDRVFTALQGMVKLDGAALEQAAAG